MLDEPFLNRHPRTKDDPGGKKELDEVVENLRHWKDHCTALGYDSDGEKLSQTGVAGSEDDEEIAKHHAEASSASGKGGLRGRG